MWALFSIGALVHWRLDLSISFLRLQHEWWTSWFDPVTLSHPNLYFPQQPGQLLCQIWLLNFLRTTFSGNTDWLGSRLLHWLDIHPVWVQSNYTVHGQASFRLCQAFKAGVQTNTLSPTKANSIWLSCHAAASVAFGLWLQPPVLNSMQSSSPGLVWICSPHPLIKRWWEDHLCRQS